MQLRTTRWYSTNSFDQGKGKEVEDLSGKKQSRHARSQCQMGENGKINSGVFFDEQIQKGVVAAPASDSLAITKNLTMEVWVSPRECRRLSQCTRTRQDPHTYYLSIHQSRPSVWMGCPGGRRTHLEQHKERYSDR